MSARVSALERIVRPGEGSLPVALAEYILQLDFPPEDHARYLELSGKAQAGTLTQDETAQLDDLFTGKQRPDDFAIQSTHIFKIVEHLRPDMRCQTSKR